MTVNKREIEQYCADVLSECVVACKAIVAAVKRFQSDLKRAGDEDFPYYFCEETAEAYCDFFPEILCHSKGEFAKQPFFLQPWQKWIVWQLFGWKRESDGKRRYETLFKTIAKKNGKSTFAAAIEVILLFADGEQAAEVLVGATSLKQAAIIHIEAERMVKASPWLLQRARITNNNIAYPATNSFARPVGADRALDGPNVSGFLVDEMHSFQKRHREYYSTLSQGGDTRLQSLTVITSTKGNDKSDLFNEELGYCRKVLSGEVVDETLLAIIYEIDEEDDCWDESCWIKANPNLGVAFPIEKLRAKANALKNKPTGKLTFERYRVNRSVSSTETPITVELLDDCTGPLSDWMQADGIGFGVDLGGHHDPAAYAMTAKFVLKIDRPQLVNQQCPKCRKIYREGRTECKKCERTIYRYETRSMNFISKSTTNDLTQEPWASWIDQGKLTVSEYVYDELVDSLEADAQDLSCGCVAYDPNQAAHMAETLSQKGLLLAKMPQTQSQFNETMKALFDAMSEGRWLIDENDPVLRKALLNMAILKDSRNQMMPCKKSSKEKIDAAVAGIMSLRAVQTVFKKKSTGKLYVS